MSDEVVEEEVFPPPNPIPMAGRIQTPLGFDWATFVNDEGEPFGVLVVHTLLGSISLAMSSAFIVGRFFPLVTDLKNALAEPTVVQIRPRLFVPGEPR